MGARTRCQICGITTANGVEGPWIKKGYCTKQCCEKVDALQRIRRDIWVSDEQMLELMNELEDLRFRMAGLEK